MLLAVEQPLESVTTTETFNWPMYPAEKMIEGVPLPEVIVPFEIDQAYVAPGPASGTEATKPGVFGQADGGAVMAADGTGRTTTLVVEADEMQPLTFT